MFGRLFRGSENAGWTFGPNTQVPYNNGENIDAKDIVLWYEGYLPHSAAEGTALWHSTGCPPGQQPRAPAPARCGRRRRAGCERQLHAAGERQPAATPTMTVTATSATRDLNNSGMVTTADLPSCCSVLNQIGQPTRPDCRRGRPEWQRHGNAADFAILRSRLNAAPGPSGLAP